MKVSVCMITYNHQDYIKQAIEGVLMQETNFDFELIIANDNSPDNTANCIEEIMKNHPQGDRIIFLNNKKNIGMMPNFIKALKAAKGNFIALCEGDDYWVDNRKLQKQVDFLEANNEYAICFHKVNIDQKGKIYEDTITKQMPQSTTIYDLALGNYIHTCSVLFRNNLFSEFPDYFYKSPIGDYYLHMLNSQYGSIYCIDEIMANYRVHDTSYWSSKKQEERLKIWVEFLHQMKPDFKYKVRRIINKQIKRNSPSKERFFKKLKRKLFPKK